MGRAREHIQAFRLVLSILSLSVTESNPPYNSLGDLQVPDNRERDQDQEGALAYFNVLTRWQQLWVLPHSREGILDPRARTAAYHLLDVLEVVQLLLCDFESGRVFGVVHVLL